MRCVEPNSGKIRLHGNEESNDSAIHLFDEIDNCVDETLQKVREHFPRSDFAIVAVGFSSFNMNLVGVNSEGKVIECATLSYACNLPEVADECRVLRRYV